MKEKTPRGDENSESEDEPRLLFGQSVEPEEAPKEVPQFIQRPKSAKTVGVSIANRNRYQNVTSASFTLDRHGEIVKERSRSAQKRASRTQRDDELIERSIKKNKEKEEHATQRRLQHLRSISQNASSCDLLHSTSRQNILNDLSTKLSKWQPAEVLPL